MRDAADVAAKRGTTWHRRIENVAKRRNLVLQIHLTHENRTVPCAPRVSLQS
jgi:hypothetical protein